MKAWMTDEEMTMYRLRGYTISMTNEPGVDGTYSLFGCMLDGKHHREDGPAYMRSVGDGWLSIWYQHGLKHRDDGPAVIWGNGELLWYQHGQKHRDNGPAVIHHDGKAVWYQNGKIHRLDGPAIIHGDGGMIWCQHGRFHREDGPAVVHSNGSLEWWLNGIEYQSREDWEHDLEQRERAS